MRKASTGPWACLTLSLLITACGGGGGGGDSSSSASDTPPTENPTPPALPTPPERYTLSGTITTSSSQTVDSDTNDPARPAISNDLPSTPQSIPNPVTLGGYINRPGTGSLGRSRDIGDVDDYFLVELLAGQRVTMLVGDFEQADADLYLMDTQGRILDFSIEVGEVESLVIPVDGTYLVNAFAARGATNYTLAIGSSNTSAAYFPSNYDIVPWEAIVTYKNEHNALDNERISRNLGLRQRAGGLKRARLMAMNRAQRNAAHLQNRIGTAAHKFDAISEPDLQARWETLMTVKSLRRDPRVRTARPNYKVYAYANPDDEAFPLQWHYPLINLPDAWETTTGNSNVVVAVIDTGILMNHPDLSGQLVAGYDFVRDPAAAADGNGIDTNPEDPGSSLGGGGDSFHGTHVSGTVAARGNNGIGVAGSAYGAKVMPLRAIGTDGGGTTYDVNQALRYAAGLPNDSGTVPAQPADIINLSLGGAPFELDTQELLRDIRAAGIVVVAAAGNEASSRPAYPASYDGVVSVSAIDAQRRLASYSNTGPDIDISAPGGNGSVDINGDGYPDGVLSTSGTIGIAGVNYGYAFLSGTSMAAPHVAGILALMKSINPALTPDDIDSMLNSGELSDDLGPPGRDDLYGHGLINAQSAVFAALEATGTTPADNPRLAASASSLNFGSTRNTLGLSLQNAGKSELEVISLSVSEPWLQVSPTDVDENGLGEYNVSVDRSALPPGIYAADLTVQSSINNLAVRVLVSEAIGEGETDIGVIYILVYDPLLNTTVAQIATAGQGGEYPFEFTGLAAGNYEVVAGSDTDNDLFVCDAGEACGAWLTIDQPIRIALDADTTGLDFPVEYLVSLPSISANSNGDGPQTAPTGRKRVEH